MSRILTKPSDRLCAAAEIAAASLYDKRDEDLVAVDVGCDHAKLAIYLVQSGLFKKVFASDINDGPLEKARQAVAQRKFKSESLENYIEVVKSDGLCEFENQKIDAVFILGMGGEVISGILDRASFIKKDENKGKIRFILQAMTSEYELREYLHKNGFAIEDERLCIDKGRIYSIMSAVFDGVERSASNAEYILGKANIEKRGDLFESVLERRIRIFEKTVFDRKKAGLDTKEQEEILNELLALKKG